MKCSGCGEEYIGQTGNYLRKRVMIHNQQIRDPKTRMLYVSGHIDTYAHQLNPKYTIFPFYKMYTGSVSFRCAKENYFIIFFETQIEQVYLVRAVRIFHYRQNFKAYIIYMEIRSNKMRTLLQGGKSYIVLYCTVNDVTTVTSLTLVSTRTIRNNAIFNS